VLCADHAESAALAASVDRPVQTYGLDRPADWQARDVRVEGATMTFEVLRHGASLDRFSLGLVGRHNVSNALAALAVATPQASRSRPPATPARFRGIAQQTIGVQQGVQVVDDYGHHPAEMAATLAAARGAFPGRRLVLAFQPHRFTRTRDLFEDFVRVLSTADALAILPIYAASEPPIPGHHEALVSRVAPRAARRRKRCEGGARLWLAAPPGGHLVLLQGAGDVNQAARPLLDALAGRGA
jgi:UDP-N-acetylmuramate--alanine ligase